MEGFLVNQIDRDSSSQRSMRNSPKKLNPKRKKTDSGSRQNRLGRTFSTENVNNLDVGSLRCSSSINLLPSRKPPLLPLPPNLPQKSTPQPSSAPKAKQKGPRNHGGSVQDFSGWGAAKITKKVAELPVPSFGPSGPDPSDLPTEILGIFRSIGVVGEKRLDSFFLLSPPPSSLPLPKFSVKQKASCRSEATAGDSVAVDSGATDSLRRILRLPWIACSDGQRSVVDNFVSCVRWR